MTESVYVYGEPIVAEVKVINRGTWRTSISNDGHQVGGVYFKVYDLNIIELKRKKYSRTCIPPPPTYLEVGDTIHHIENINYLFGEGDHKRNRLIPVGNYFVQTFYGSRAASECNFFSVVEPDTFELKAFQTITNCWKLKSERPNARVGCMEIFLDDFPKSVFTSEALYFIARRSYKERANEALEILIMNYPDNYWCLDILQRRWYDLKTSYKTELKYIVLKNCKGTITESFIKDIIKFSDHDL